MGRSAVGDRLFQHSSVHGWLGRRRIEVAAVRKSTVTGKNNDGSSHAVATDTNTSGPMYELARVNVAPLGQQLDWADRYLFRS